MMEAHTDAGFVVGEPFGHEGLYDFGGPTSLTKRVTQLGGVMMQHRWASETPTTGLLVMPDTLRTCVTIWKGSRSWQLAAGAGVMQHRWACMDCDPKGEG